MGTKAWGKIPDPKLFPEGPYFVCPKCGLHARAEADWHLFVVGFQPIDDPKALAGAVTIICPGEPCTQVFWTRISDRNLQYLRLALGSPRYDYVEPVQDVRQESPSA